MSKITFGCKEGGGHLLEVVVILYAYRTILEEYRTMWGERERAMH